MNMKKVRISTAVFSAGLTVALGVFVWVMLGAGSGGKSGILLGSLSLIVGVTVAAQVIYALKGQIFEFDGRLAKREVLFALICFQVVMQFSFGFSLYAVNQTELQNSGFDSAYAHFIKLQQLSDGNNISDYMRLDLEAGIPEHIDGVFSHGGEDYAVYDASGYYRFPVNGGRILMSKSQKYFNGLLRDFALSLIMSLVVSVLLMVEVVLLAVKLIDGRNVSSGDPELTAAIYGEEALNERSGRDSSGPAGYLRQIAFLFYFTGYLGASFIPIMARNLAGSSPAADFIAGLPYSVEAFANCAAILFTAGIFGKRGWKPPYFMGVAIFIAGLTASALSPNVFVFIASRGLVGMGYGFCWMTLRNVAAQRGAKAQSFAELSSGIYAGIMCGVAFGAVLADMAGFRTVLMISAAMALAASVFPMTLRNESEKAGKDSGDYKIIKLSPKDIAVFAVFLALIVIPTCISEAFRGYLLPLYINDLELPTAYIGRVSLAYNLCLVYISSTLLLKIVWKYIKNPLFQNITHMVVISAALFSAAYLGGFTAILIAGILLGSADGFGFSAQNSYILDMRVSEKIGLTRMLTLFSLFKKFSAMLAPFVFGLFIMNGFGGLGLMGVMFIICAAGASVLILLLKRNNLNI
ncbi:MAG: MFS transporter [Oscillospiraceae bacterium]|nr:MFS transporter [Oscillospiraceae bacterium]